MGASAAPLPKQGSRTAALGQGCGAGYTSRLSATTTSTAVAGCKGLGLQNRRSHPCSSLCALKRVEACGSVHSNKQARSRLGWARPSALTLKAFSCPVGALQTDYGTRGRVQVSGMRTGVCSIGAHHLQ